ncbi:hypothetical protein TNCV_4377671 [Trichonephila clavipes]|nr:hypothetical protein TNCV_4377671 [Trichonephila clavipes]
MDRHQKPSSCLILRRYPTLNHYCVALVDRLFSKAAFTQRQPASSVERLANQRVHLARDEVSDWVDAQRSTLAALV